MAIVLPVIWTPKAQRDLLAIRDRIAADRPGAAERFTQRLEAAGNRVSNFPEAGRAEGASRVLVTMQPYVIRYRVRPEGVVIIGVRHGRRQAT